MNGSNSSIVPSSRGFKAAWTGVDSISVCDVRVRPMTSNGHQAKRPRGAPFNVASFPWARPPSNSRWFSACLYRRTRIGACGGCVGLARAERAMTARASCRIRMAVHHGVGCFGCQRPVSSTADRECVDGPADALALEQAELKSPAGNGSRRTAWTGPPLGRHGRRSRTGGQAARARRACGRRRSSGDRTDRRGPWPQRRTEPSAPTGTRGTAACSESAPRPGRSDRGCR